MNTTSPVVLTGPARSLIGIVGRTNELVMDVMSPTIRDGETIGAGSMSWDTSVASVAGAENTGGSGSAGGAGAANGSAGGAGAANGANGSTGATGAGE
ncbi:MAG: hypothetical protein F2556_02510 [Actinobacteria bacterium]|nr:hypothetical protein [Actinomycetota bacterium]